jgi:FkbM family methyltransferase
MRVLKNLIKGSKLEPVARSLWELTAPKHIVAGRRDNKCISQIISYVLSEDSNCIDVGAHKGEMLGDFLRLAPLGKHYAFEPLPFMAEELKKNFPQIEVRQTALSDSDGEVTFFHNVDNPGYSGLKKRRYDNVADKVENIDVKTQKLDDILPPDYKLDFIKVDVEGAEYNVFKGALRTLKQWKPYVLFEFGEGAPEFYGVDSAMMYDLLVGECGLRIFTVDGSGPLSKEEFSSLYSQASTFNFLAHP